MSEQERSCATVCLHITKRLSRQTHLRALLSYVPSIKEGGGGLVLKKNRNPLYTEGGFWLLVSAAVSFWFAISSRRCWLVESRCNKSRWNKDLANVCMMCGALFIDLLLDYRLSNNKRDRKCKKRKDIIIQWNKKKSWLNSQAAALTAAYSRYKYMSTPCNTQRNKDSAHCNSNMAKKGLLLLLECHSWNDKHPAALRLLRTNDDRCYKEPKMFSLLLHGGEEEAWRQRSLTPKSLELSLRLDDRKSLKIPNFVKKSTILKFNRIIINHYR